MGKCSWFFFLQKTFGFIVRILITTTVVNTPNASKNFSPICLPKPKSLSLKATNGYDLFKTLILLKRTGKTINNIGENFEQGTNLNNCCNRKKTCLTILAVQAVVCIKNMKSHYNVVIELICMQPLFPSLVTFFRPLTGP